MSFESEVGDLPSILKVEKRRLQATIKPGSETWEDTALMIDRYKYCDLFPCTSSQMEAIGYAVGVTLFIFYVVNYFIFA